MQSRHLLVASIALGLILPLPAWSQLSEALDSFEGDEFHDKWSRRVLDTANRIDSLFGDDRIDEEAQQTRVRAYGDLEISEDGGTDFRVRVKAHLVLPNTKEKLRLELNGTDDDNAWDDEDRDTDQDAEDRERSLGLNFNARRSDRTNTDYGIGARYHDSSLAAYLKARNRVYFQAENWLPRLTNEIRVYSDTGWQYQGTFDMDRELSDVWFFRSRTEARWYEEKDVEEDDMYCDGGWCLNQFFSLYQDFPSRKVSIAYDWNNYFLTEPDAHLEEVQLASRIRFQSRWDWLHWEIRPYVRFLDETDFRDQYGIVFRLEGIFGYKAKTELRFRDTDVDQDIFDEDN